MGKFSADTTAVSMSDCETCYLTQNELSDTRLESQSVYYTVGAYLFFKCMEKKHTSTKDKTRHSLVATTGKERRILECSADDARS